MRWFKLFHHNQVQWGSYRTRDREEGRNDRSHKTCLLLYDTNFVTGE
jgi:hypothetical protein